MDTEKLLAGIEAAARRAGAIMLSASDIERKTSEKEGHGNFVTALTFVGTVGIIGVLVKSL